MIRRRVPYLIVAAIVAAAYLLGGLNRAEHALMDLRFAALERDASGKVAVVEIDSLSLAELDVWPWPRRVHAMLLDRLSNAGARRIALDIDFGARTGAADDAALGDALRRTGSRVVLPLVAERTVPAGPDASLAFAGPLARFRQHADLAVSVARPEGDGLVRRYLKVDRWRGNIFPTLAASLAGTNDLATFHVDYGIRAETIPRYAYVDVLKGRVPSDAFAGRVVLVGATALDVGEMVPVPRHLALPGPYLHALAFESIVQGRGINRSAPGLAAIGVFLLAWLIGPWLGRFGWRRSSLIAVGVAGGFVALSFALQAVLPVSLDVMPWALVSLGCCLAGLTGTVDSQTIALFRQGRELMHRSGMLRELLETSPETIFITDAAGMIELANPAAGRMLERNADEIVGRNIRELLSLPSGPLLPDGRAVNENLPADMASGAGEPCELQVKTASGREIPVELQVSALRIESLAHPLERRRRPRIVLTFSLRDLSERKRAEAAQCRSLEEALAASRAKSEFISNMGHELRTPLNAIIGFSEMLKKQVFGPIDNERYLQYAGNIHGSGTRLLEIINDILDSARIETGNYALNEEPLSLPAIIASALELARMRPEAQPVTFVADVADGLPALMGDERLIRQAVIGLLSNGAKFSHPGAHVVVRAAVDESGGAVITVADNGIGMHPDIIDRVTVPFYQVDGSLERKYEGTGLGLYLVSQTMALHGGDMEIRSEPGHGATVILRFPKFRLVGSDGSGKGKAAVI
jgi:PAS domain S-box-containing protein